MPANNSSTPSPGHSPEIERRGPINHASTRGSDQKRKDNAVSMVNGTRRDVEFDVSDPNHSPNRHTVRAQVHSPPLTSYDDIMATWAPTSGPFDVSNSADNLNSKKLVQSQQVY